MTVRERLLDSRFTFTRSEMKVVGELLSNYPSGGLATVSRLARRAGVSDPTVVRLAHKLGYDGFADLQERLLAEVEAHLSSPLTMLVERRHDIAPDDILRTYLEGSVLSLKTAGDGILPGNFDAAAALLADLKLRVFCLGGRFSRHLSAIMKWHLQQIRPDTEWLGGPEADLADRLVDMGAPDVLVVYDFRRYQSDVVLFAAQATALGCKTILITDKWKSPIAQSADIVFTVPVESASPFDTMVPALMLTEALIAAVTKRLEGKLGERLEAIEKHRNVYHVTLGAPSKGGSASSYPANPPPRQPAATAPRGQRKGQKRSTAAT